MRCRTCVIGLGLIGGSLLRALAAAGHPVSGYDAAPDTRAAARAAARAADPGWRIADSIPDAASDADLVVLAVPLPVLPAVLDQLAAARWRGVLSDVTSVKGPVRALVRERLPRARYVGGHPMAGKELSGFAASEPELFHGCAWALTLEPGDTTLDDWLRVADLVTGLGARVVPVTTEEHDVAVAMISHLPHLVASAIAAAAGTGLAATLAAGSYRDGTRVAASRPALVAAMCGGNAEALGPTVDQLVARLTEARRLLDDPDPIKALAGWFGDGYAARTGWPPTPGPASEIPVSEAALLRLGRDGGWVTAVSPDMRTVTVVQPAR